MRRVGLLVAGVVTACAGAEARTTVPVPPPAAAAPAGEPVGLNPGESMAFELRVAGVLAGEAQLAVGALGDYEGHRAVVVKSRAATAGAAALLKHVVDEATTVIDFATGRPLVLDTLVEQGDKTITANARFTESAAEITYTRSEDPQPRKTRIDFSKGPGAIGAVHDAHSAMAQMRGWRAAAGARRTVFIVGGRRLWRVDMTYGGSETLGSVLGNRRAIKLTGASFRVRRNFTPESTTPGRTFTVWLSDDADRVPLKVSASTELGDIVMTLTEYTR